MRPAAGLILLLVCCLGARFSGRYSDSPPRWVFPRQVAELAAVVAAAKADFDGKSARLEERRQRLKECDEEIAAVVRQRQQLEQRRTDLVVDKKKLNNKCARACRGGVPHQPAGAGLAAGHTCAWPWGCSARPGGCTAPKSVPMLPLRPALQARQHAQGHVGGARALPQAGARVPLDPQREGAVWPGWLRLRLAGARP